VTKLDEGNLLENPIRTADSRTECQGPKILWPHRVCSPFDPDECWYRQYRLYCMCHVWGSLPHNTLNVLPSLDIFDFVKAIFAILLLAHGIVLGAAYKNKNLSW